MLQELHIENYALIRSIVIRFDDGFNVITGETGAGKSILLGALSLILGQRADSSVLFDDSKKCFVEGKFNIQNLNIQYFFEENDLDYSDISIVRREINESGKSRAFINDTPVNLQILKQFSSFLIDIHSQQSHLLFQQKGFKSSLVDQFAQQTDIVAEYQKKLLDFHKAEKKLLAKEHELRELQKEQDYISFQINELSEIPLTEGMQEELENKLKLFSNAEVLKTNILQASYALEEADTSALSILKNVKQNCEQIAEFDSSAEELPQRIESLIVEIKDILFELASKENMGEVNPNEIDLCQAQLDHIYRLEQKYHVQSVTELLEILSQFQSQNQNIDILSDEIEKLSKEYLTKQKDITSISEKIYKKRAEAAPHLEKEVMEKMEKLGMPDGNFKVAILHSDKLLADGADEIHFLFSANKGQNPQEIEKVASGGELSRMMLAMKSIISSNTLLPTVVFDEIDTGISGEIAGKAAQIMAKMAENHQLIVITHLPQVAAKGKNHLFVYKEITNEQTFSNLRRLEHEERIDEIAKMISGNKVGDAARTAAKELF